MDRLNRKRAGSKSRNARQPVDDTAIAFAIGLLIIPFGLETKGQTLPD
ncbi:MAG: hypothetical protein ACRD59_16910 [Candidatus Acidiferrales bacterium]